MARTCIGIALVGVMSMTGGAARAQEAAGPETATVTATATAPATAPVTVTATATAPVTAPVTATATAPAPATVLSGAAALGSPVIIIGVPAAPPTYPTLAPPLATVTPAYASPTYGAYGSGATYASYGAQAPLADTPPSEGRRVGRVFAEAGLGLVGMLVGGFGGALVGMMPCAGGSSADGECIDSLVAGVLIGLGLGTPAGIALAGRALDGNGGFGWTLLGTSIGFLVAGGLVSSVDDSDSGAALALVPVLGGILAYELSSDTSARYTEQHAVAANLQASIGPTRGGAAVSLSGAF